MSALANWIRAVRVIPRVTRDEWDALDPVSRWLIASRAAVLVLTFTSATIGGLFAALAGKFHWPLYGLTVVGLLLAHAASNLFNDYFDYRLGLDRDNYFRAKYGPQPLVAGLLTERRLLAWATATMAAAGAFGAALTLVRGPVVAALALAGMVAILGYSFSKRWGLGEPLVIAVWGPLLVGGSYFVIAGEWSARVAWASLPYALGATSVLFGKHIDKFDDDRDRGIRTLPILLGLRAARGVAIALVVLMHVAALALAALDVTPWLPAALALFALDKLRWTVKVFANEKPAAPPPEFPAEAWPLWYVAFAFVHNRKFGVLYLAGLAASVALIDAIGPGAVRFLYAGGVLGR
ncbi:MAG: prenyltransferase [Myxococcota bacterium]